MNVRTTLEWMITSLAETECETPDLDARVLMAHALGIEPSHLLIEGARELAAHEEALAFSLLERRMRHEPVAYITGKKEFYSLEFLVGPEVLIPRPETELLVDMALYHAPRQGRVLDLGTGSGAIAVSIKHNRKDLAVYATDISPAAVESARANCARLLGGGEIIFATGDLFEPVDGEVFDLIASNPPYVDPGQRDRLRPDLAYEPSLALYADDRGGAVVFRIIDEAPPRLAPGGMVIMELCPDLRERVMRKGRDRGFDVSIINDYGGFARVALLKQGRE
ncbi:MAG TPA: peptide chain release factor N(5)-glutamine methyltransferase [Spirochaetes bacterium]|nr:peptide chain release factor N(5)-glutamine methyltransferase [Spirochaetota bacterium]